MTKHETSCGAVVYFLENNEPNYLVIRHRNGGHWAFTKGHMEESETEEETALREIEEETGITKIDLDIDFKHNLSYFPSPEIEKKVVYFTAEVEKQEAEEATKQEAEVLDIKWLELAEAKDFITYENDRDLLEQADSYIKSK